MVNHIFHMYLEGLKLTGGVYKNAYGVTRNTSLGVVITKKLAVKIVF